MDTSFDRHEGTGTGEWSVELGAVPGDDEQTIYRAAFELFHMSIYEVAAGAPETAVMALWEALPETTRHRYALKARLIIMITNRNARTTHA